MPAIRCPHCNATLKARDPVPAGAKVRCPKCQGKFAAGRPDPAGDPPPPPPATRRRVPLAAIVGGLVAAWAVVMWVVLAPPWRKPAAVAQADAAAGAPDAGPGAGSRGGGADRGEDLPAGGNRYALLVGVNAYQHDKLAPLKYAVADATELAGVLGGAGYDVALLTDAADRKPTGANVKEAVKATLTRCQRGDTVVLAFAGHGLQFDGDKDAYFCRSDARPSQTGKDSLVSLAKLYAELTDSFAGVKVLLVDACRNDPDAGRGARGGVDADTAPRPPRGVAALFSCSAGERAFEHESLGHGVFFHHLLKGLKGEARDGRGRVTFAGLAAYVSEEVAVQVPKLVGGAKQSPNLKADLSGASPVLVAAAGGPAAGETVTSPATGMTLVRIPAGRFTMGSPDGEEGRSEDETPHEVTLTRDFYLGVHEVTRGQFRKFAEEAQYQTEAEADGKGGYGRVGGGFKQHPGITWLAPGFDQTDRHPVVNVSWNDAVRFAEWLSAKDGRAYRLPTEAEWEYACRARAATRYHFGDDPEDLARYANVADASAGRELAARFPKWTPIGADDGYVFTAPVGSFRPNPFRLHDMYGNVQEWCADWYGDYPAGPATDPTGPAEGTDRVFRGGGWFGIARGCRSATRSKGPPSLFRSDRIGFRLVMETPGR